MHNDNPFTSPEQGKVPSQIQEWASYYRSRSFAISRIRAGQKRPMSPEWTTKSAEQDEFVEGDNIGLLMGWLSCGGLVGHVMVSVDLDSADAIARADDFLPATGMVDGRPSKPRAHRYYLIPTCSIPEWATSKASQAAEAAALSNNHPGAFKKAFRILKEGKSLIAIDFLGTGSQCVAPPSLHETSGETREWEGGVCGEPAIVDFLLLWGTVCQLASAIGCQRPANCQDTPGFEVASCKITKCLAAGIVRSTFGSAVTNSARAAQSDDGQIDQRLASAARYLAAIRNNDLSRAGSFGHNTLFRHVSAIVNGFSIFDERVVLNLFINQYNARLVQLGRLYPNEGLEPWTDDELLHKIRDAIKGGPPEGKVTGWLLANTDESAEDPMAWNNPARLACGLANRKTIRFLNDSVYHYDSDRWAAISDGSLRACMQLHAETEARKHFLAGQSPQRQLQKLGMLDSKMLLLAGTLAEISGRGRTAESGVPKVSQRLINDALGSLRARCRLPDGIELDVHLSDHEPRDWLRVRNGILDLETVNLAPHDPDWFSLVRLPVTFETGAVEPKRWLEFLDEVMGSDSARIALLQEIFGWCLDRRSRLQHFVLLVGSGANGKGVYLHVLQGLLGRANCSAVGLSELSSGNHRFAAFGLLGKLANLKGDQAYIDSRDESALKELTGGDLFSFEQKGKQPIYNVNRAKLIFVCNQLPTFGDKSEGVWRRLIAIPFELVVLKERRNPAMLTDDYWSTEMPGILNWALAGLARLRASGQFGVPEICQRLSDQHRNDSNPARGFLLEHYEETGTEIDFVSNADVHGDYIRWCNTSGYIHKLTSVAFGREVSTAFPRSRIGLKRVGLARDTARGRFGIRRIDSLSSGPLFPSDCKNERPI